MKDLTHIYTCMDLEMNQPSGKIIQIGAVIGDIKTGEILEHYSVFVNPNEKLSPEIVKLTGITQQDVDGGHTLEEAYGVLKNIHIQYKSVMNPATWGGGDSIELLNQLKKENPEFNNWCFGRRWIDVKTLFISWRIANDMPFQGGLAKSLTKVGLKFEGRKHNALDDSLNTFKMFQKMLELMKTKTNPTP